MGCTPQAMSCSDLTIIKLELSRNLLVPLAFSWRVLIWNVSALILFWHWQTSSLEIFSENFYEVVWKTMLIEYFLNKVADLQPNMFYLNFQKLFKTYLNLPEQLLWKKLEGHCFFFMCCVY